MKNLLGLSLFAMCVLMLIIVQTPNEVEGLKKVLKKLKSLKKLKKYAWILAAQRKKFYAIPFPMPLPVFVKRQQIYTQVPIIPRYVQRPPTYGAPAYGSDSVSSYSYSSGGGGGGGGGGEMMSAGSGTTPSEVQYPAGMNMVKRKKKQRKLAYDTATSAPSYSSRYLQQIVSALGATYPALAGSSASASAPSSTSGSSGTASTPGPRDVLSKLLTGQAKVLTPASLLTSIKASSAAANSGGGPSSGSSGASLSQEQQAHNDLYDQPEAEQDSAKSHPADAEKSPHPSSASKSQADSSADPKPSASEFYRSIPKPLRSRMSQLALMQQNQQLSVMPINRLAAFGVPMSPLAALASSQMQRIPMLQASGLDFDHLQDEQQDPLDMAASQENEQVSSADGRQTSREHLLRELLLAKQMQQQASINPVLARQLLLAKHRQQEELYRMALLAREQEAALVRASQMSMTSPAGEQAQVARLLRARRELQYLQQLQRQSQKQT